MDHQFVIPGTNIRFGLDPLISLVPRVGATASAAISLGVIALSFCCVPKIVLARMALNVLNAALYAVPAWATCFRFRSNARNYELLRKHAGTARATTRGDWLFLMTLLGGVGLAILGIFAGVIYLVSWLFARS